MNASATIIRHGPTTERTTTGPFSHVLELMEARRVAEEHDWNISEQALRGAEVELEAAFDHPEHGIEARRLHAEIAMSMARWQIATNRWSVFSSPEREVADYAKVRNAFALRRLGKPLDARAALDTVSSDYRANRRFKNESQRVSAEADNWSAIQVSFAAYNRIIQDADFSSARNLVLAAATLRRFNAAGMAALVEVIEMLDRFFRGDTIVFDNPTKTPRRMVAVGGFGWSGSGAVTHYLDGSERVMFPTGDTEVTLFEGESEGGFNALQLLNAVDQKTGIAWRHSVTIFILWTVFGLVFPPGKQSVALRWYRKSLAGCTNTELTGLVEPIRRLLAVASVGEVKRTMIARAAALIYEGAVGPSLAADTIIGLNNSIHARSMSILRRLEGVVGLAVFRDPRDQYVARASENFRYVISTERFIRLLRDDLGAYRRAMKKDMATKTIHRIQYEDFVTNPAVRAEVAHLCGVGPDGLELSARFDPEKSARNIGIHRTFPNQKAVAEVAAAFPDLLWEGYL